MSGAAGLAAARRRRGAGASQQSANQNNRVHQPPPVPQQHQPQQQSAPNNQVYPEPTSPMAVLQQHHMKIDEHVKIIEEMKKNIDDMKTNEETTNRRYNEKIETERNATLEYVKEKMLEPLESDLQSILNGYQLKIDMLTSTMNSQQNYIMELNTTLLGIVKQMTKLLAIKENEGINPFRSVSKEVSERGSSIKQENILSSSMFPDSDNKVMETVHAEDTEYFASEAPEPFHQDTTPVATFGNGGDLEQSIAEGMNIDGGDDDYGELSTNSTLQHGDNTNIMDDQGAEANAAASSPVTMDTSSDHPEVDLSVE